jgi:hypothetical protein
MDHDTTPSTAHGAPEDDGAPEDTGPDRPGPEHLGTGNHSGPCQTGGAAHGTAAPAVRLCSPGSLIASIPFMFGFHPENSLVVLGLNRTVGRERIQHGIRIGLDQVRGREHEVAADLRVRLRDHDADEALLIAFAPRGATGTKARPDHCRKVMAAMKSQLAAGPIEDHIKVADAIFTSGNRWWSYLCRNKRCCPAGGTMIPAEPPQALVAMFGGNGPVYASREAMDATFAPYGVTAVRRVKTALKKAAEDAAGYVRPIGEDGVPAGADGGGDATGGGSTGASAGPGRAKAAGKQPTGPAKPGGRGPRGRTAAKAASTQPGWTDEAVLKSHRLADRLLARCRAGVAELSDAEAAALLVGMVEEWRVRDYLACVAFEEERAELLLRLMTELSRRAPDPGWRTTPLSLAAWAAWSLGRTALAQCAVDRALATDSDYHFALLIRAGLQHGISSDAVRASADNTRRALFEEELRPSKDPASSEESESSGRPTAVPPQRNLPVAEEAR